MNLHDKVDSEAWIAFAAQAMNHFPNASDQAKCADALLAEFQARRRGDFPKKPEGKTVDEEPKYTGDEYVTNCGREDSLKTSDQAANSRTDSSQGGSHTQTNGDSDTVMGVHGVAPATYPYPDKPTIKPYVLDRNVTRHNW